MYSSLGLSTTSVCQDGANVTNALNKTLTVRAIAKDYFLTEYFYDNQCTNRVIQSDYIVNYGVFAHDQCVAGLNGGGVRASTTKIYECGGEDCSNGCTEIALNTCTSHERGFFKKTTLKRYANTTNTTTVAPSSSVKTVSFISSFVLAGVVGVVAAIF